MNKQGLGLHAYIPLFLKLLLSVDELLFLHPRLLQRFLICALLMLHLGREEEREGRMEGREGEGDRREGESGREREGGGRREGQRGEWREGGMLLEE